MKTNACPLFLFSPLPHLAQHLSKQSYGLHSSLMAKISSCLSNIAAAQVRVREEEESETGIGEGEGKKR